MTAPHLSLELNPDIDWNDTTAVAREYNRAMRLKRWAENKVTDTLRDMPRNVYWTKEMFAPDWHRVRVFCYRLHGVK